MRLIVNSAHCHRPAPVPESRLLVRMRWPTSATASTCVQPLFLVGKSYIRVDDCMSMIIDSTTSNNLTHMRIDTCNSHYFQESHTHMRRDAGEHRATDDQEMGLSATEDHFLECACTLVSAVTQPQWSVRTRLVRKRTCMHDFKSMTCEVLPTHSHTRCLTPYKLNQYQLHTKNNDVTCICA